MHLIFTCLMPFPFMCIFSLELKKNGWLTHNSYPSIQPKLKLAIIVMMLFAWFIYRHIIMIIRTLNTNYYKRMVNFTALKLRKAGVYSRVDDSNTSIGKRYARNDELGTPFGLTLDFACTLLFFRFWVPGLIPNNIFSHTRAWYYFFFVYIGNIKYSGPTFKTCVLSCIIWTVAI